MLQVNVSDRWCDTFPGSHVGLLLMGNIDNSKHCSPLEQRKREVETRLRQMFASFSRADFLTVDILRAYRNYYKQFGNTYHVQLQLESIAQKGKSLPRVSPLVDANFAAELDTLVLTAGHDADLLESPLTVDATQGGETFIQMNGSEKILKPNDMMMTDAKGIVCTILYGQDRRTSISPKTTHALYVAYAPPGITTSTVHQQLDLVRENIGLFAPEAKVHMLDVYSAE